MDTDTCSLFEKVAKKMGWEEKGGLDVAEKKLIATIGKSRQLGTSDANFVFSSQSDSDDDDKENLPYESKNFRINAPIVSSDDDFEQFLQTQMTPKTQINSQTPVSSTRKDIVTVSSDSDGTFETFIKRVKTPSSKPRTNTWGKNQESLRSFIVNDSSSDDDFIDSRSSSGLKKVRTPSQALLRRPLAECYSPVFVSDSDDEEDKIVITSTWKTRVKPQPSSNKKKSTLHDNGNHSPSVSTKTARSLVSEQSFPKRTLSAPSCFNDSSGSEEEFASLLDRLKKRNILQGGSLSPASRKVNLEDPVAMASPANGQMSSDLKFVKEKPRKFMTPSKNAIPKLSQTDPRPRPSNRIPLCKTPGCFLETLSNPGSTYGSNFKHNKDELSSRLFRLYNTTVFDGKLPEKTSVTWNKKMRKTAGYCITGQERGGGSRYARIELSEKVCDSADRLRDTLIHEMCHAATWLINGVRDGHGNFWKLYARKATVVHPELPMVTRCHSYDIKYKFQYQCVRCQNTIGRHSKSLDTERFACALCMGKLVLLNPSKPRTATPFATFVKENYGAARQGLVGQSHGDVMRKLSADFASKAKLSQS